jgi:hypothetical protein
LGVEVGPSFHRADAGGEAYVDVATQVYLGYTL